MIVYATDEDIALRASADFSALCPRDQVLAQGSDGVFGASDLWTLASASVDFAAFGLNPGQMVRLVGPSTSFGPDGDLFAIEAVVSAAITLRRQGQLVGVGQPPAPSGGLTGVEFVVRTLGPQIERASRDVDRRFGIDDRSFGHRPDDLLDPRQLREAVVLTVLYQQYLDRSLQFVGPTGTPDDVYAAKSRIARADLDDALDRLTLRWKEVGIDSSASTTRFSTRISR